jgi:hypothetical protein
VRLRVASCLTHADCGSSAPAGPLLTACCCCCCCCCTQASAARSHEDGAAKQATLTAQLKTARDESAGLKKEVEKLQRQLSDAQDAVKVRLLCIMLFTGVMVCSWVGYDGQHGTAYTCVTSGSDVTGKRNLCSCGCSYVSAVQGVRMLLLSS